jgi:hypothetical protein
VRCASGQQVFCMASGQDSGQENVTVMNLRKARKVKGASGAVEVRRLSCNSRRRRFVRRDRPSGSPGVGVGVGV